MRHSEAVAELSETITRDFDKPLTDRGIHQLEGVRAFLKEHHFLPDLILCSSAVRTRQTLEWIQEALGTDAEIGFDDALYGISSEALIDKLTQLPHNKSTVLVVGHNPSISEAIQTCFNHSDAEEMPISLPARPSQLVIFHFDSQLWSSLKTDTLHLEAVYEPEN
jgi:phosphohistidine phosphatase